MKCDAVFEGGGVNGVGLCGAISVTETMGYEFNRVAGTSAGSIVAALIASGYGAKQISEIVSNTDYRKFCDKGKIDRIPLLGPVLSIFFENGFYEGITFSIGCAATWRTRQAGQRHSVISPSLRTGPIRCR